MNRERPYTDIVFDLETLSVRADATIVAIGACGVSVPSKVHASHAFYTSVSIDSQRRHFGASTLQFWITRKRKPSDEDTSIEQRTADALFANPVELRRALDYLTAWTTAHSDPSTVRVWGYGATFDLGILKHAYDSLGLVAPWAFRHERCLRTLIATRPNYVWPLDSRTPHFARDDAIAQAHVVFDLLTP
jgi:exodeoxyribonuclease VIII